MHLKSFLKQWVYSFAREPLTRSARRRSLDFGLCYHRFESEPHRDPKPGMAITPDRFRRHLQVLSGVGSFIDVNEAVTQNKEKGIRFFLTFDDGYRDNVTVLLPILEEFDIPACIYVATGWLSGQMEALDHDFSAGFCPPGLTEDDLKRLAAHPLITLGAHTVTHRDLGRLPQSELEKEILDSRDWLSETTGQAIEHFAFPFGQPENMNWDNVLPILEAAGIRTVVSSYGGVNGIVRAGPVTHLRRVPAPNTDDEKLLLGWVLGLCNPKARFFNS